MNKDTFEFIFHNLSATKGTIDAKTGIFNVGSIGGELTAVLVCNGLPIMTAKVEEQASEKVYQEDKQIYVLSGFKATAHTPADLRKAMVTANLIKRHILMTIATCSYLQAPGLVRKREVEMPLDANFDRSDKKKRASYSANHYWFKAFRKYLPRPVVISTETWEVVEPSAS